MSSLEAFVVGRRSIAGLIMKVPFGFDRYHESTRHIISFARTELSLLGGREVEPNHLLLGLLRSSPDTVIQLADGRHGVVDAIRERIVEEAGGQERVSESYEAPFSAASVEILERAMVAANSLSASEIMPLHMLMAMATVSSPVSDILQSYGVGPPGL